MASRYTRLIERIFLDRYKKGDKIVKFLREEIEITARAQNVELPKNLGDVLYSFRFRNDLPNSIAETAPKGQEWLIKLAGRGAYEFSLEQKFEIVPRIGLASTKILDSTPGIISKYSLTDEQALLAILRYNRLIDTFLGLTCYSLENHLRTTVKGIGQVETDEVYVGVNARGVHFIIPVQAKGGKDKQGKVQIIQDIELCRSKFDELVCVPIAAQFMEDRKIALFSFDYGDDTLSILDEQHYQLVKPEEFSDAELRNYIQRSGIGR